MSMAEISGYGAPNKNTVGAIGDIYTNLSNGKQYKCVNIFNFDLRGEENDYVEYEWSLIVEQSSGSSGGSSGDASITHSWNGTVLTVTSASGTSSADLKGETGEQGPKGDTGATGEQGPKGDSTNVIFVIDGDTGVCNVSNAKINEIYANSELFNVVVWTLPGEEGYRSIDPVVNIHFDPSNKQFDVYTEAGIIHYYANGTITYSTGVE